MAREINLVPDIKAEMIKTLKLRNLILFACIVVAAVSVSITIIVGLIAGGQQLAIDSKKETLDTLSTKLNSYSDLKDFLTIKDQLGNLSALSSNQKVLSRTFDALSAFLPQGADTITVSELEVDLSGETPTFAIEAQADAGKEPFIDYNVLDSFKKSMQYMRYDYGKYVDKSGNVIPAYCMIETSPDGAILQDQDNGLYAYWTINAEGCNQTEDKSTSGYNLEDYQGQQVVRIWRTPQFSSWYQGQAAENQPHMNLDGTVEGIEHFESNCITYRGNIVLDQNNPKWEETNECSLVPNGNEGIQITDSSNGRDERSQLVLRFSAVISLHPEFFRFSNTHMLALAPSGRHNVTDSYVQIQAMFGKRASDCQKGDTTCTSDQSTDTNNQEPSSGGDN